MYVKLFMKCKTQESRGEVLADFLEKSMKDLHKQITSGITDPIYAIKAMDKLADKFTRRSVSGDYKLANGWYRSVLANVSDHKSTEFLFVKLGWNYGKSKSPQFDEINTVEYIGINIVENGKESVIQVPLLLEPICEFPVGSIWKNIRSGIEWTVIDYSSGDDTVVCESENVISRKFSMKQLRKSYKRLV